MLFFIMVEMDNYLENKIGLMIMIISVYQIGG